MKKIPAIALALLVLAPAARAQEEVPDSLDVFRVPRIVVTADRVETPVAEVGVATTVVTRAEIERVQHVGIGRHNVHGVAHHEGRRFVARSEAG